MGQRLRVISNKRHRSRGIVINKNSIGTIYINGVPYTYNAEKVETNRIDFDDALSGKRQEGKRRRRKIYIRRR